MTCASLAGLWAVRRYYRNWGATKAETRAPALGDELIHEPVAEATAAEWIDVPIDAVWPRVMRVVMGEHWANGDPHPSVGDEYRLPMTIGGRVLGGVTMSVVDVVDHRALVLRTVRKSVPVDVTCAWLAEPRLDDRTRLVLRIRIALRHPGDVILAEASGPILALLTRRALAGIKDGAMNANTSPPRTTVTSLL